MRVSWVCFVYVGVFCVSLSCVLYAPASFLISIYLFFFAVFLCSCFFGMSILAILWSLSARCPVWSATTGAHDASRIQACVPPITAYAVAVINTSGISFEELTSSPRFCFFVFFSLAGVVLAQGAKAAAGLPAPRIKMELA